MIKQVIEIVENTAHVANRNVNRSFKILDLNFYYFF